ncbi:HdaA/DnaA family protein [Limnobacter litoralis]|nr:DnaA/Hda family protein [Limnobacter litoralis]
MFTPQSPLEGRNTPAMSMQQLLLDVFTPPKPNLGNFLVGKNAQVLHSLHALAQPSPANRLIYLYGPPGCGKSHLLKGAAELLGAGVLKGADRFVFKSATPTLIVDDIDQLTPYSQVQLFNACNAHLAGEKPVNIVMGSTYHPAELKIRDDLRTRISAGLCWRVEPLTDEEKFNALQAVARGRGLELSEEVVEYALRYFQRDMGSLMAVMDGLDRFSLEQHKPVSVHLLRHWMKRRESLVVKE